jgi:hypothetical protein
MRKLQGQLQAALDRYEPEPLGLYERKWPLFRRCSNTSLYNEVAAGAAAPPSTKCS